VSEPGPDPGLPPELDAIEGRLRHGGSRQRVVTQDPYPINRHDVDDVRRRGMRQLEGRRRQLAGALAVVAVISTGAVTAAARILPPHESASDEPAIDAPADPTVTDAAGPASSTRSRSYATTGTRPPTTAAPTTAAPSPETAPSTAAPASPSTAPPGVTIERVDVARVARDDECGGGNRRGPSRPATVTGVTYGNVVGDDRTDAVVTVACAGSAPHASVYSLAPGGVARVAAIEPDPATRLLLVTQDIGDWTLAQVSVAGTTVESRWTGNRRSRRPLSFTLRQRWTGNAWQRISPLQFGTPPR
jgi:hypothetical protein